jgi:hypothetical protein
VLSSSVLQLIGGRPGAASPEGPTSMELVKMDIGQSNCCTDSGF